MSFLTDAHNHIIDEENYIEKKNVLGDVKKMCIMSATDKDWEKVSQLLRTNNDNNQVIGCFGIHPWFAHLYADDIDNWGEKLKTKLMEHPNAIVGEIGVDQIAIIPETGTNEYEKQIIVFEKQWDIACEMNRPISVHCVKGFFYLLHFFRKKAMEDHFPPAVMMHSFGGKDVNQFLKLPKKKGKLFYFSFSYCINTRSPKTNRIIGTIPEDQLLLESDRPDVSSVVGDLKKMAKIYAKSRKQSEDRMIKLCYRNLLKYLNDNNDGDDDDDDDDDDDSNGKK